MKLLRTLTLLLLCLSLPAAGMAASMSGRCSAHTRPSAPATTEHDVHAHHAMMMGAGALGVGVEESDRVSLLGCDCGCLCIDHCAVSGLNAPVAPNLSSLDLPRVSALGWKMGTDALRPARRSPLLRPPRSA